MAHENLIENLFLTGKDKFDDMEIYIETSKSISIGVFNGEVDKYSIAESGGLSLRGVSNNKMGYSYTEKLDETSVDMLINEAYENASFIESAEDEEIFAGADKYKLVNSYSDKLSLASMEQKINLTKELEKQALSLDKRVTAVQACGYEEFEQWSTLVNTKGIDLSHKTNGGAIYVQVIVKEGEDTKTAMAFRTFSDLAEIDINEIAKEAVEEATSLLGASPIKTGEYPMIIKNTVFGNILAFCSSIFSAEYVDKGLSLLKDKIGENIASKLLTIVDDPFLEGGFASCGFDGEGMSTSKKKVIHNGFLTTYLHSLKTAKKFNVTPTGNSTRASYKSPLSIAPSNFYVEPGDNSLEEMLSSIENGIYVIDVAGLHSGLNPVSGDFSLSASGYEIKEGKILRPINQITIAGNFYQLLKDIESIGVDLVFGFPAGSYFGSPSIKISSISVAGDN